MNKKINTGLAFVFIVVLAGAVGYFVLTYIGKTYQAELSSGISSKASQETSISQKSDNGSWKTYKNDQYGFSFAYPPEISINLEKNPQTLIPSRLLILNLSSFGYPKEDMDRPAELTISVYKSVAALDIDNKKAATLKDYLDKYSAKADPQYVNVIATKIGNVSGYKAESGPNVFGGGNYYFTDAKGSILEIWNFDAQEANFKKILDSFRLLN